MQNERKDEFMKMNKKYVVPQISVMHVSTSDVITTSPAAVYGDDNIKNDPFED